MQTVLPLVIIVIGLILLVFKIYADSEPGALPLLLLLVGSGWYLFARRQLRGTRSN